MNGNGTKNRNKTNKIRQKQGREQEKSLPYIDLYGFVCYN